MMARRLRSISAKRRTVAIVEKPVKNDDVGFDSAVIGVAFSVFVYKMVAYTLRLEREERERRFWEEDGTDDHD